jgi:mono/diheme cytochrome c family protein
MESSGGTTIPADRQDAPASRVQQLPNGLSADPRRRGFAACATLLTILAALLLLSPLASARTAATSATPKRIAVTIRDGSFKLSATAAPLGGVSFAVKNAGTLRHSFKIAGKTTPVLAPGKSATLIVTFTKPGASAYVSTVAGDTRKGLKGVFTIQAAALPAGVVGDPVAGRQTFLSSGCGSCHRLKAAGTTGGSGANLDEVSAQYSTIVTQITKGGEGMTAYANVLTKSQIQDVAAFVYVSTHP